MERSASTSFPLHCSPMDSLCSSIEYSTLFSHFLLRERLMLLKGLTEKLSPLIQDLKKDSIKSTPFNTVTHSDWARQGKCHCQKGFLWAHFSPPAHPQCSDNLGVGKESTGPLIRCISLVYSVFLTTKTIWATKHKLQHVLALRPNYTSNSQSLMKMSQVFAFQVISKDHKQVLVIMLQCDKLSWSTCMSKLLKQTLLIPYFYNQPF